MAKINKEKQAAMPQKLLKELLEYNGATGGWVNKINRGRARVGRTVGTLNKKTGYVVIGINGNMYQAHRLAWVYTYGDFPSGEQPFIDHINGKRADNRIENLRVSSHKENNKNKQMRHNNTSGVNGVSRVKNILPSGKINEYWRAHWYDEDGTMRSKNFSILKLGEKTAMKSAIDYREEQIRLLESNHDIIYSERHGI